MLNYITDTKKLEKAMIDADIKTKSALSDVSGVGRDTIGRVLGGKIQPSAAVMHKIAVALNLTPDEAGEIFFAPKLT